MEYRISLSRKSNGNEGFVRIPKAYASISNIVSSSERNKSIYMVTPPTKLIPCIYSSSVLNSPSKTPSGYVASLKVPTRLSKLVRSNGCNVNKIRNGKYLTGQIRIAWAVPQKSNMTRATENVIHQFGNETIELRLLLEILHMVSSGLVQDNQVLKMWGNSLPI